MYGVSKNLKSRYKPFRYFKDLSKTVINRFRNISLKTFLIFFDDDCKKFPQHFKNLYFQFFLNVSKIVQIVPEPLNMKMFLKLSKYL